MREQRRSWLALVTFCMVTVLMAALGSAVLFAGVSVAFAVAPPLDGADTNSISEIPAAPAQTPSTPVAEEPAIEQQPKRTQPVEDGVAGQSFAGMITDSRCGARHQMNSDKTSAECVRSCVRNGAHYVLVDGEKLYALEGDPVQLEKLAGERVRVVGMREGDTIKVKTVVGG